MPKELSLFLLTAVILCTFIATGCDSDDDEVGEDEINWITGNVSIAYTDYYVSVSSGSDDAPGTSETAAFATIAHALETVHPGGTVFILPGTYHECIGLSNTGNSGATITIESHDTGANLNGSGQKPFSFYFENCTNIAVRDLHIENYTDFGIGGSSCSGLAFTDLTVTGNGHVVQLIDWELEGYGIHIDDSDSITIENNDVSENGPNPRVYPGQVLGTGINTFNISNAVIIDNDSYDNNGGGILVEDSRNVLVEDNEIWGNDLDATEDGWWDGGIWIDGGWDITLRDNYIHDNLGPGIEISDEDLQNPTGYVLENNNCEQNYYGIFIWNFGTNDWPDDSIISRSGNDFTDNNRQDVWIIDWF